VTTPLRHTWQVSLRYIRALVRQPAWVGISLVQPVIWLLLFGALFKRTADIPGFTSGSYIEFLTPGVVVMLAISTAGWVGMAFIDDINRGTMDRLLVSPIWRGALNLGSVAQSVLSIVIQSAIVVGLSLAVGGHFRNGVAGVAVLIVLAGLLGAVFASLSNGVAVLTRQRETLIGLVTMVTLPLTFLSSALMQQSLLPDWIQWISRFNPVNWAAEAGRSAVSATPDWSLIASRSGFLAALLLLSAIFATRAFASYQRSI
jgi:ABC-2 type transport system permease protein